MSRRRYSNTGNSQAVVCELPKIFKQQLIDQYFYEGLCSHDRSTVDVVAGGALADKTPTEANILISPMAEN